MNSRSAAQDRRSLLLPIVLTLVLAAGLIAVAISTWLSAWSLLAVVAVVAVVAVPVAGLWLLLVAVVCMHRAVRCRSSAPHRASAQAARSRSELDALLNMFGDVLPTDPPARMLAVALIDEAHLFDGRAKVVLDEPISPTPPVR